MHIEEKYNIPRIFIETILTIIGSGTMAVA